VAKTPRIATVKHGMQESHLAMDQGPIVVMIESSRTDYYKNCLWIFLMYRKD